MRFIEYTLSAERLCIGERIKAGVYKPSAKTIPYSQITGAIKHNLGLNVHAVGVIDEIGSIGHLTIGPKDRSTDEVKLPIKAMFLEDVKGKIFIIQEADISSKLPEEIFLYMGGLRMKGFGKCLLNNKKEYDIKATDIGDGKLRTRIPVNIANIFGITAVMEKFGYLFEVVPFFR